MRCLCKLQNQLFGSIVLTFNLCHSDASPTSSLPSYAGTPMKEGFPPISSSSEPRQEFDVELRMASVCYVHSSTFLEELGRNSIDFLIYLWCKTGTSPGTTSILQHHNSVTTIFQLMILLTIFSAVIEDIALLSQFSSSVLHNVPLP